jgi:hypothetical protein
MRKLLFLALATLALAGCGSAAKKAGPDPSKLSDRLVDFSKQPPFVNSLGLDPETGEFMLTTNKGFWRIDPKTKKITQIKGTIEANGASDTVGTFLEIEAVGGGKLLGSGHPDLGKKLPQFLGYLESQDNGKSWEVVSRLGEADLHKIVVKHDRIYAWDAVLSAMLISEDGGKTFESNYTPPGLVMDFVVDPDDPEYLVASTEDAMYKSTDAGKRWRQLDLGTRIRLEWPEGGPIIRAEQDGTISTSDDKGATWKKIGTVAGEPYKFETTDDPQHLYLALSDGTIIETTDGGKTWKDVFRP